MSGRSSFSGAIRRTMLFRRTAYVSAGLLSLLILLTLCPIYLVPESTEAATKDANPATLTYNATSSAASVSLTVSDDAGVFASSGSNELASFDISTNNATGYTLNLKVDGTGDTTSLSDGTNTIASITNTNGITASSFSNNTWGLLPSKYNGTVNTGDNPNYYPASTTGFKMDETSAANTTANTYTVGLGVKVNHNTPAGTYTNTAVVAEYVANAVTYSINYYTNAGSGATITGMPSTNPQTGTVSQGTTSTSVNLATAPSRTGYTFLGWCLGSSSTVSNITTADGVDSCSTTTYDAGQSFGIDATKSPDTYYLYAMWEGTQYTATIYYKGTSGVTSSTATKCRITSLAGTSCDATIDSTVRSSTGTYSNAWAGIATAVNSMTPVNSGNNITLSSSSTYYAFYRANVTNYYYTGSAYTSRTLYRNQTLSSTSAMGTTYLSDTSTGLSDYSTAGGPNSSTWYGLSTALSNTTRTYSSVSAAAASTSTTLNSIYQFTQNFSSTGSTGVSGIGSTVQYCYVSSTGNTAGGTSCSVTTPTISVNTGYTSLGWGTQGHTTQGTAASTSYTVSTSGGTLYANAKLNTYNLVITGDANVSAVSVKKGSTSGTSTTCTKSGTKFTCSSLDYGVKYYLYPTFTSGYAFNSWTKTDSATNASLGSTSTENTYYQMGAGAGAITLASKLDIIITDYCAHNGIADSSCLQKMKASDCTTTAKTVTDSRDGKTYRVKKLSDTKCWMLDNLALDLVAQKDILSSSNTNATDQALGYLKGTTTGTASDQWAMAAVKKTWTSSYSYSEPWIAVDSTTSGPCSSASSCTGGSALTWSSTSTTSGGRVQGKVGVYYNYCAASAGSYCYSSSSSSGNATEDICPYGWHLPAGDTAQGSFYYLYNTGYSANYNNFVDALSTPLSGYFGSGKAYSQGSTGIFWSSTRSSNYQMYSLYVNSSYVNPQSNSTRDGGFSVRCVRTS